MALNLDTIIADYNGTSMAVAGHAEWGFIPDLWFLPKIAGKDYPANYVIGTSGFTDADHPKIFLKAQYAKLINGGIDPTVALFVAMLRAHMIFKGTIANDLNNRSVLEDETYVAAAAGANWADAANNIPPNPASTAIAKFVKRHGNTIVHQMVYVFSARGHHWSPDYDELYKRLRSACFMDQNPGFVLPSSEVMYRLAIHPFGIKALAALTLADKAANNMAAAMALRYTPSAPIAGVAHITTMSAVINHMRSEPWWGAFDAKFHAEVTAIDTEVGTIQGNPYEFHVAAKVFGHAARRVPSQNANKAFSSLSQYCLGYIDHLGRRHSLSGQQAITQKSGGAKGLADAFAKACDNFGKPDTDVDSMTDFLAQA